jgi:uncharacterized protein (TIGR02117 family)
MRQGGTHFLWLLILCIGLSLGACGLSRAEPEPGDAAPEQGEVTIFVTSNGWHSEIVVPRALLPAGAIAEAADFPDARYLSFGWGDETYYPESDPSFAMTLNAAFLPTPAVVHLAGLAAHPGEVFPADEVIELRLSSDGFARLTAYLDASFARQSEEPARTASPGLYDFSRFYPATGEFHLFNTCNTWTARGLQEGGLAVKVFATVRAEDLMAQVRRIAAGYRGE